MQVLIACVFDLNLIAKVDLEFCRSVAAEHAENIDMVESWAYSLIIIRQLESERASLI